MRHQEPDSNQGYADQEVQLAFYSLRSLDAEPSSFLKTRVLARIREKKENKQSLFKKYILQSALSFGLVTAVLFGLFQKNSVSSTTSTGAVASYTTGQAYVIRMDIRPHKESAIAYAEILLSDDRIEFASQQHAQISSQKKIIVSWENLVQKQFLPIVIKGTKAGNSKVIVNFYDLDNKLVNSQDVNLNFKGG